MKVDCRGCAGCCIDWRAIAPGAVDDRERRGRYRPIDDVYNLVPLTRDDARAFLDAGLADALIPRLFHAEERGVEIDGVRLAAIDGKPAFFLGLRKPPKPVAPFDRGEAEWLPACVFLDPATLQCRIHDSALYPDECAAYPGHNLALDAATECERVEASFGGERLLDDAPPERVTGLHLGPAAVGGRVFVHPEPATLAGVVGRLAAGESTAADRASFVAAAVASAPGSSGHDMDRYAAARERAERARSWASAAIGDWERLAATREAEPPLAEKVEDARGAPETPGWNG